jgi:quercetin dioxygenase-like cupin family protein
VEKAIRVSGPCDVMGEARKLLGEMENTANERTKRTLPSANGLQTFLLFIRKKGRVPDHHVKGPITVQSLIGNARMTADGESFQLPQGSAISFAAEVAHDVSATTDAVLLVTHALPQ